jgi:hypothetical protein
MRYSVARSKSQSNTVNKTHDFKIGNPEVIVDILRNKLYSDKIRVVVQEYLCNARDAMREAKNTSDRIQITLPTRAVPVLKIRDFGPGLTPERVEDVFVQFGHSTKRGDNEQTGGFGLGGKSAFAYTDSFMIISVCEGLETHYVAHLGKSAVGTLEVVHSGKSNKKNGVEIQIGVNASKSASRNDEDGVDDLAKFHAMVFRTICFWEDIEKPVIENVEVAQESGWRALDDKVSKRGHFSTGKTRLIGEIADQDGSRFHTSAMKTLLVCDGIVFDTPESSLESNECHDFSSLITGNFTAYMMMKAGELEIAASREAIAVNEKNEKVLKKTFTAAASEIKKFAMQVVNRVTTIEEAKSVLVELHPLCESARNIKRAVQGINIDFADGTLLAADGYVGFLARKRSYTSRIKIRTEVPSLSSYLIHNDSNLKPSTVESKVRELARGGAPERFTVIPQSLSRAAKLLGATPISSLKAKRTQAPGDKTKRAAVGMGQVYLKVLSTYGSGGAFGVGSSLIDLNKVKDQIYVMITDVSTKNEMGKFAPIQELLQDSGVSATFCFPSKTALKAVSGISAFVKGEDFLKDIEKYIGKVAFNRLCAILDDLSARELKESVISSFDEMIKLSPLIDDLALSCGITAIANRKKNRRLTYNLDPYQFDFTTVEEQLRHSLVGKVPMLQLLKHCRDEYKTALEQYNEPMDVVYYINGKYKYSQGK